jgi:hypothetical protein
MFPLNTPMALTFSNSKIKARNILPRQALDANFVQIEGCWKYLTVACMLTECTCYIFYFVLCDLFKC